MTEMMITRREARKKWERTTSARHTFRLHDFQGYILEVEDLHFHHDSAVLLPDYKADDSSTTSMGHERITGLAVLCACYHHVERNPAQKILIAGHTDTTGKDKYNLKLSQLRAEGVLYALTGDRERWAEVCQQKHKAEDYQQILKWLAHSRGWDCYPGKVDDLLGPKTRQAIKAFQKRYNEESEPQISHFYTGASFTLNL